MFQATSSDKHVVGCGLNGSSIFKVSAVLLEVFLHGASQWTAWNLGGGLSRRSILKVFSMRFRIDPAIIHGAKIHHGLCSEALGWRRRYSLLGV